MNRVTRLHGALAVCVFLFIGLGLALARPGLVDYAPNLSFSPDTDGVKAVRLLMEREGAHVKEWRLRPERLPDAAGQLFVAVEPYGVAAESNERLIRWAEQGNDVVVFGPADGLIEEAATVFIEPDIATGKVAALDAGGAASTHTAIVASELRFAVPDPSVYDLMLRDEAGVLALRKLVGGGSVTIAVTGEWLRNENILEAEHFELSWLLLGVGAIEGRAVYFDEYHHGYSISPGIAQVYPMWLLAALLQAALGALAWLWWRGKRFGPAYTQRAFLVRRGDETLLAVAGWFKRGRLSYEALDASVGQLRRMLQARTGVPAGAGAGQLLEAAERALAGQAKLPAALQGVLERWEQLSGAGDETRRRYGEKQWLADSTALGETLTLLEEVQ